MTQLKDILYKVSLKKVSGATDIDITSIHFDSRKVEKGSLFIATRGTQVDGHDFINDAVEKGAVAVVCEEMPAEVTQAIVNKLPPKYQTLVKLRYFQELSDEEIAKEIEAPLATVKALLQRARELLNDLVNNSEVTYVETNNSTQALGIIAANYYGNPSAKLKLVGVTGTNGKTTSVTLLFNLFRKLGYNTGLLSTVENKINDEVIPATHTTPDAITLNKMLRQMVDGGVTHCFMEVSSHAIVQNRVAGLNFAGGVFTNITHDHLDYHKTFDEYIKAKKLFFDGLSSDAFALSNADDKRGTVMLQNTRASKSYYGLKSPAEFKAKLKTNSFLGLELVIDGKEVWFKLTGSFNAYNLLGVYGAAVLLGEDSDEVLTALSNMEGAKGRFEQVVSPGGITVIVDYAHTPDALENVLKTINDVREGQENVITVVGCGGNRDAAKRPVMADIATKLSDKVVLTSDNPRNEDPEEIIKQMKEGVSKTEQKKVLSITDRKEGIRTAVMLAQKGDIILVAGKGHETYQEVKGVKSPFDDKKVVVELFNELGK